MELRAKQQPAAPSTPTNKQHKRKLSMSKAEPSFVTPSPTPQASVSAPSQQQPHVIPYAPYNYCLPPQAAHHHPSHYNYSSFIPPQNHYHHQHHYDPSQHHDRRHHHMSAYSNNPQQFSTNLKRQRRQAAAAVVTSSFSFNNNANNANNNMGRKSTAQPRPVLNIPPRGIGPIVDPNDNDVLCGRGGRINSHAGNVHFREIIHSRKKEYLAPTTKKLEKAHIAAAIVNDIRGMDPPGRFLKEDRDTGLWFDIGDAKAIKKTGQALREDAPDIRPDLEGDDSSGDEKSPKRTEKKSPKAASPKRSKSPKQRTATTTTQVWPQGVPSNNNNRQMQAHEYQAQMAMPPPKVYPPQPANQMQMQQQQSGFETRNIPIPAPNNMRQMQQNFYTLPNQLYSGAQSVTSKMRSASKQAMAALSQPRSAAPLPDDIAFGRPYHPPETQTVLSSDNTMSTISGLSENLSSNMSGGGFRPSALMNMSIKSSGVANRDSLQISSLQGLRPSGARGHNSGGNDSSMGMSGLSAMSGFSALNSLKGGLQRSYSMGSIMEGDNWKAIMAAGDEMLDETAVKSILSGSSAKHSLNSGGLLAPNESSAMSIGGLSMDLASNASSTQWLAAAGLGGPPNMGDDHTTMSGMSANLDALDLASLDRYG